MPICVYYKMKLMTNVKQGYTAAPDHSFCITVFYLAHLRRSGCASSNLKRAKDTEVILAHSLIQNLLTNLLILELSHACFVYH